MTTKNLKIAKSVAKNNSRSEGGSTWVVTELPNGLFDAVRADAGYPSGTICAYRNGRKVF